MAAAAKLMAVLLTVVVNGQPTQIEGVEKDGQAYVEAVAFARALGATATYDQASKQLVVSLPAGGVMGTTQMAGEWAEFGRAYTINEDSPLNFTLNSAEYDVARLNVGEDSVVPTGEEKLLVLHMTIQNPQSRERRVYWADLEFTAVDAMNVNREWSQELGIASTGDPIDMDLKPAQKLDLYTAIVVPARGVVPKLIVKSGEGKVLRYDLRGKVAPLAPPFADPNDPGGATALARVEAEQGVYYPTGLFDLMFQGVSTPDVDPDDDPPEEGEGFVALNLRLENGSAEEVRLYSDRFRAALRAADGEKLEWGGSLLHPSRNESLDVDVDPGDEIGARVFFRVPAGTTLSTFEFSEGDEGRLYVFDLAGFEVRQASAGEEADDSVSDLLEDVTEGALGGLF